MKLQDKLSTMKGTLTINVINRSGETTATHVWNNLITTVGYSAAAQALAGVSGAKVASIGMGVNATPPKLTDTALSSAVTKPFTTIAYNPDTTPAVQFNFTIDFLDAVGMTIFEWGLITQDGRLFSRLTRAPIQKTNEMMLVGHWLINM